MTRHLLFIANGCFPLYYALYYTVFTISALIRGILLQYTVLFYFRLLYTAIFDTFPLFLAFPALFRSLFPALLTFVLISFTYFLLCSLFCFIPPYSVPSILIFSALFRYIFILCSLFCCIPLDSDVLLYFLLCALFCCIHSTHS
jgi:hypothetical protein